MHVTVSVTGDAQLIEKLRKLDSEMKNFSKAFQRLGEDLVRYYSDTVFASMGGVFGTPWMMLAPSTIEQKTKQYRVYASVPLIATGAMKDSFTAESDAKKLVIDNTAPYFVYHQSEEARSRLPRRQMLGASNDVKTMVKKIIENDIKEKIASL